MNRKTAALAAVLMVLWVGRADAQDHALQQVRSQLARVSDLLSADGWEQDSQDPGWLRNGESRTTGVFLRAGMEYLIAGVCDNDCSDFDLTLLDHNGRVLGEDEAGDDKPVVGLRPLRTGMYRLRATMAKCSINPCRFLIGFYNR